jgi:hypothetical protein
MAEIAGSLMDIKASYVCPKRDSRSDEIRAVRGCSQNLDVSLESAVSLSYIAFQEGDELHFTAKLLLCAIVHKCAEDELGIRA